ncbi:MAG: D-alanyl-D-alanine carboxypeptidase [Alphaproteobacteria bacterium]|nr:D-alanyl-D-alanine carboxypeptidase [Alphaproteobacteria bacterium]
MKRFVTFVTLIAAMLALAPWGFEARADMERYAAFVVDENTGAVMHSRRSEASRYPASLTKMMTLYMLFEAIDIGEIGLEDQIRVSANAASAPPSRIGFNAGETIRVEDAILALAIKSANDVAVAVGERLGGGEASFAAEMTERARALGLEDTTFRNASGLPDRRQTTTARDMARLAVALHRDFPHYFHYFNRESFTLRGRTYRNHNSLVGRVDGVDGLKTGYIRASGFNLVASAERGENRLIAVVMGGPTAAARDAHAEELLEAAFGALEQRQDRRHFIALSSPRVSPLREEALIARDYAELDLAAPTEMGSAQEAPPLRIIVEDADRQAEARTLATPPEPARHDLWAVQVGAYNSAEAARSRLDRAAPISTRLASAQRMARSVDVDGQRLWRARFEALSALDASAVCREFSDAGEPCFTVAPGR